MATILSTANLMATYWATLGNTYSLHTGNPGAAGTANEASGGGYSRQSTVWGTAAGGVVTGSQLVFPVLNGNYTHACRWSGTTLRDIIDITDVALSPAGEIKFTPSSAVPYV